MPILTGVDTRKLVFTLRDYGTPWGALVRGDDPKKALERGRQLIAEKKKLDLDWAHIVSLKEAKTIKGRTPAGPKIAALDLGCKTNSLRELVARCSEIRIFPSRTTAAKIRAYNPDGIFWSNGPGDPG